MKALLVVDVQNDFCPGGSLAVKGGDEIVPLVNDLLKKFPLRIFTQDWHPANHLSFAVNHPGRKVGEVITLDGLPQVLWPAHCVQETDGAAFHPKLQRDPADPVFLKGTDPRIDSYSAFYDNAHRKSTALADFLRLERVTDLTICGLATDYCVFFSALDAVREGFGVTVLANACRGVELTAGDSRRALDEIRRAGGHVVDSP